MIKYLLNFNHLFWRSIDTSRCFRHTSSNATTFHNQSIGFLNKLLSLSYLMFGFDSFKFTNSVYRFNGFLMVLNTQRKNNQRKNNQRIKALIVFLRYGWCFFSDKNINNQHVSYPEGVQYG